MDFNSAAGFLHLAGICGFVFSNEKLLSRQVYEAASSARLCIWVVLQELPNSMNVIAPDCSSWGVPARGTSRRSYHNYQGVPYPFVVSANYMVSKLFGCNF